MADSAKQNSNLYSDLKELVSFRFHVKQKKLKHQQNLLAHHSGEHTAMKKGRGMTFSEVRQYQPGDDIRHIDWRVTARTQKTHTKLFVEEHERPTILVTEQTPNLFFGSQVRLKAAQAMNISAVLAWVSLQQNERVGGLSFNHLSHSWVSPKRNQQTVLHYLQKSVDLQQQLSRPESPNNQAWPKNLQHLLKLNKPGNKVFLIGDMIQLADNAAAELLQLNKTADISAIHIYDPLEKQLPELGWLTMTPSFQSDKVLKLDSFRQQTRQAYSELYQQQWHNTQEQFSKLAIPLVDIGTHQEPIMALIQQQLLQ